MSENCNKPRIRIEIRGGMAHVIECDNSVDLEINDYDVESGFAANDLKTDDNGDKYAQVW